MRIDVGMPDLYQYKNRGLVNIFEYYDPHKGPLDERFMNEMAKQLTQSMAALLGWDNKEVKRRLELTVSCRLTYEVCGNIYFHIFIYYSGGLSTLVWILCEYLNTNVEKMNPYAKTNERDWRFTVVEKLEPYVENAILTKCSNPVYYEDWVGLLTAFYGPGKKNMLEKSPYSFDASIECGWPDVLIRLYMKKAVTPEIKEQALSLLTEFLQSWNEAVEQRGEDGVIHDVFLYENVDEDEDERKMQITIFVDFGNAEPSILENLLHYINDSDLNVKKVVFS